MISDVFRLDKLALEYTEIVAKIISLDELKKLGAPKKRIPGIKGQATKLAPTVGDIGMAWAMNCESSFLLGPLARLARHLG